MCRKIILVVMIFAFSFNFSYANVRSENTENIKTSHRSFLVTYNDGTSEKILVEYVAKLYHKLWQSGRASTISHPIDNRKCHWTFQSTVHRKAYFIHRTGIKAPLESYDQIFYLNKSGDRGADNFLESLTYHRTCGDSMGSYNTAYSGTKNGLVSGFNTILSNDKKNAIQHLKELLNATKVIIQ